MQRDEKRVLVVDDDEAIRTLLLTILRRHGMVVDTAKNGAEALQKLGQCWYAIMLLDLMMPVLSGWEVLQKLATFEAKRRPLVIVLTAGSESRSCSPDLVIGSIRKPFDVELLDDMVVGCIATVSQKEQLADCPPAESDQRGQSS
ncbi:MAG TPA: response regulator [Thermoanaerobaculia bacterium]|jgi:DNA-binding response OmpR family regulator